MAGKPKPLTNGDNYLIDKDGNVKKMTCSELREVFGKHAGEVTAKALQNYYSQHPNEF